MKKISSFLVLMLIALMLFVSCNNSTPTKEESNSSSNDSSNGSTPTIPERDATNEDAKLVDYITYAISNIRSAIEDVGTYANVDKNGDTFNYTGEGCTVTVENASGDVVSVTLVGSATVIEEEGEGENTRLTFKCNLTDVTIILDPTHTVKASCTLNISYGPIEVHEAIIDGKKVNVNKLTEMLNNLN